MNPKIIEAASNALGYELDDERVADAIAVHEDTDTRELEHQLRKKRAEFDAAGNHGVDLADEIDDLRIALAARSVTRGNRGR